MISTSTPIAALGTLLGLYSKMGDGITDMSAEEFVKVAYREGLKLKIDGSITRLLSKFIVEPVIICSDRVRNSEVIDQVLNLNIDTFCSFYMQAFKVLTGIYNMDGRIAVDLLGTDTSSIASATFDKTFEILSKEEHTGGFYRDLSDPNLKFLSLEEDGVSLEARVYRDKITGKDTEIVSGQAMSEKENLVRVISRTFDITITGTRYDITDSDDGYVIDSTVTRSGNRTDFSLNASSGNKNTKGKKSSTNWKIDGSEDKNVTVDRDPSGYNTGSRHSGGERSGMSVGGGGEEFENGEKSGTTGFSGGIGSSNDTTRTKKRDQGEKFAIRITIMVKANVIFTNLENIKNMIAPNSKKNSFFYRLDEYKAGAIKFRDLVLGTDLIKAYKQNKLKDRDDLIGLLRRRESSANSKAISAGMIGFEKYYNMLVLSVADKEILDKVIGGDIYKKNYKERFLTEARALSFTVLDEDYERVMVEFKDLNGRSDINYKSLKKQKESNIEDFLKVMMNNNSPTF